MVDSDRLRLSRVPIRLRLTLAFVCAMSVVLAGTGLFVHVRSASALDQTINDSLRSRADDVGALVRQGSSGLRERGGSRLAQQGESFAQVLDFSGRIVDTTPQLGERPLLAPGHLKRAVVGPTFVERENVPDTGQRARLLAAPVQAQRRELVVVVGSALEARDEALSSLLTQLLAGGLLALLVASLVGYGLAAAALRPVEAMRLEAEAISASEPGRRLPVSLARDEIARLGETLNEMLSRLEVALARERSFVSDASHELRTPLALLRTEIELALRRPRSVEELERALGSAAEETDRVSQLAEDLLVLARADQGGLPVRKAPVLVGEIVTSVAERFSSRAAQVGRRISTEVPATLELVADRLRLEQGVGNLVDNALRHGAGEIRIEACERDGRIELHVLDEGAGFPESFLPRAFERFSRPDDARSGAGAGLGLAIAVVIAQAHGGTGSAMNRPAGLGADVSLSIPLTGVDADGA